MFSSRPVLEKTGWLGEFVFPVWCLCFIGSLNDTWKGCFDCSCFFSGCFLILYRCYTKKTSGKGFQFPSLQRWRESNTIKKTLVRYLKKQTKNPLTNLKSFFKKINGYILKPNQLMPVKMLTCLVYNLMPPFPVKSVSPFWLNINIT